MLMKPVWVKLTATLLLVSAISSCDMGADKPLIIGHRGAMGHETENTLASVRKALELGVDMIEIDVFKIESGEIAVFHDPTVDRLANGGGNIEGYNIADLRKLILDGNHKIPLLQDVMKEVDHKVRLNIELKGAGTADRVNFIAEAYISRYGWKNEDFLISSFRWDELQAMRKLNPDIPIGVLTEEDPLLAIEMARQLNAEAIIADYNTVTEANVSAIRQQGFRVYVWTVNEMEDIERMKDLEVNGIITNYPERAR